MSQDELTALRSQVDQLQVGLCRAETTLAQVVQRLQTIETEHREYKRRVLDALPEGPSPFTAEEMQDLIENGVTWDVIEKDLKQLLET